MSSTTALLSIAAQALWTEMGYNSISVLNDHTLYISNTNGLVTDQLTTIPLYTYDDYYNDVDPDSSPCVYPAHGASILPVLYSLFFVVGFLGNTLVIRLVLKSVRLRSMTDICLLNLAIADLLLVSSLPFLAHYARDQWIFGGPMCTMVLSVYHIGFYSGIFFIVLMSVDQYLAVVHAVFAMKVRTKTYGILASLVIWVAAVAASFPELIHIGTTDINNQTLCTSYPTTDQSSYHNSKTNGIFKMNVIGLILPLSVIGFCYSTILIKLLTIRSSRRQAIRLVMVVMVVFFCCWVPYNIAAFFKALELKKAIPHSCESSKAITLSLQITEALAYSHSCVNPFLYVFVGEKFRKHLFRLLNRTPVSRLQFMKTYIIQDTGSVYSQTTSLDERSSALV